MLGLNVQLQGKKRSIEIKGGQRILPRNFRVPGDISAATFLIAAASLVPNSQITIRGVGLNKTRTAVLDVFKTMNVSFDIQNETNEGGEPMADIAVKTSDLHSGITLKGENVAMLIDEIPMLAVMSLFGNGSFTLRDAAELRHKESDRISAIVQNMRKLGADVDEYPDGLAFESKKTLIGRELESYNDHRIAMAFGVAGLRIPGITIRGAESVDISFPGFWDAIGA
jgi:3-phosphoshikimate 1-carboxyvinyltransferase